MVLNFETEKLMQELKERKPKRVLIQLPEGIKQNAFDILKDIDSLGIEVIFSGETCWGGCAVSVDEAKNVGADLIIHFGHSEFIKVDFPVLYVEVKDELDLTPFLEKSVEGLKDFKTIGLSYAIQHKQDLESIINFYEEKGHKVIISGKKGVASYAGHVVGCEFSGLKIIEKEVDCFVIIGNNFHSMGAALAVSKPVFLVDVYNDSFTDMEEIRQKTLKERFVSIEKFKKSKKIGIIVESKVGQKFGSLDFLIKKFEDSDKEVIIITMNEVTSDKLMNFYNVESFVELGCPRIAVDDFSKYEKNIITFKEALVGLGLKTWEELLKEGVL